MLFTYICFCDGLNQKKKIVNQFTLPNHYKCIQIFHAIKWYLITHQLLWMLMLSAEKTKPTKRVSELKQCNGSGLHINNIKTKKIRLSLPVGICFFYNISFHFKSVVTNDHYVQREQLILASFNGNFLCKYLGCCSEHVIDVGTHLICTELFICFFFTIFKGSHCSQSSDQHEILTSPIGK